MRRTGDIGFLKIVHESSVAAGVRRIEAVTGSGAVAYVRRLEDELRKAAGLLRTGLLETAERTEKLLKRERELEKEIEALKGKLAAKDSGDLLGRVRQINGIAVLATVVEAPDVKTLRDFGDKLRDRLRSGIILLGSRADGKAMLLCLVTKDLTDEVPRGKDHPVDRPARRRERRRPARHGPGRRPEAGAPGAGHREASGSPIRGIVPIFMTSVFI